MSVPYGRSMTETTTTPEATTLEVARVRRLLRDGRARAIRQASGLTKADMARAVGVDHSTFSRWESGARAPRPTAALRLLRLLDQLEGEK